MKRIIAGLFLSLLVTLATLFALDRVMDRLDIGYRTRRNAADSNVRFARSEFTFEVVTNSLGFRDPRLPTPKRPKTIRVVVLGDSFTQGYGVAEHEAYPRRLENQLRLDDPAHLYEVVNLGVPGTNPRDYEGNLREVGLRYQPDVVLVAVSATDVHDVRIQPRTGTQFGWERLMQARRDAQRASSTWTRLPHILWPALYPFAREGLGSLAARLRPAAAARSDSTGPAAAPAPSGQWEDVLFALADGYGRRAEVRARLAGLDAGRLDRIRPLLTGELPLATEDGEESYWSLIALIEPDLMSDAVLLPPAYDDAWRRVALHLHRIPRLARRAGATPVITYIPDQHQVTSQGRAFLEERGFRWNARTLSDKTFVERLRTVALEEEVAFIDLQAPFREHSAEALYFPRDGHWTPAGHELAARILAARLGQH